MSFKDLPDSALFEGCRKGNIRSYNILFSRYFDDLLKFSNRYVKEPDVAEELVMDLMLNIWLKKESIVLRGEFAPYIFSAMRNTVFSYLRRKELYTLPIDLNHEETLLEKRCADHNLLSRELEDTYQEMLSHLSPQRRAVFLLSREENLTYPEIAKNLNLSVNTVENYMVSALQFFREQMKEHAFKVLLFCIFIFTR